MKLFFHFAVMGFSNTYLIGPDEGGDAILIDPGIMDVRLLQLIEDNNFYVRHIFITHSHESHVRGIKTLLKIYDATIHAKRSRLFDRPTAMVEDGSVFRLGNTEIEAIEVKGHSTDHMVYRIGDSLFTGDILEAGKLGSSDGAVERAVMIKSVKERIMPLPGHLLIFPGHGPPSTLAAEKAFNPDLEKLDQSQTQHG